MKEDKPKFVVIEGCDGAGKTTLRKFLFKKFSLGGRIPLCLTGVSWAGIKSTEMITKAKYFGVDYPKNALLSAYIEDRQLLSANLIAPARKVRNVISDRYIYSDIVYNQLHYGMSEAEWVAAYAGATLEVPDAVIFLDTPPDIAVSRLIARGKPIHHWETLDLQRRVYEGFCRLLDSNPFGWKSNVYRIDTTCSPDDIAEVVSEKLGLAH